MAWTEIRTGEIPGRSGAEGIVRYQLISTSSTYVFYEFQLGYWVNEGQTLKYPYGIENEADGEVFYQFTSVWDGTVGTGQDVYSDKTNKAFKRESSSRTVNMCVTFYRLSSSSIEAHQNYTIEIPALPPSYTVTYNLAGGSGTFPQQTTYENDTIIIPSSTPTKAHYQFTHWQDQSGNMYAAGSSFALTQNLTLTAHWQFVRESITVGYNSNGSSETAPSAITLWDTESSQGLFTWTPASMSSRQSSTTGQTMYTFEGWSTSSSASSPTYLAGAPYQISSSMTVYAVWRYQTQNYTIHYDAMGGSGAPLDQTWACTSESGSSVTLSSTTPTKDGFIFQGWARSSTSTRKQYDAGSTQTFGNNDGNFTLYAVWGFDSSYTYVTGNTVNNQWRTFLLHKETVNDNTVSVEVKAGLEVIGNQTTQGFVDDCSIYDNEASQNVKTWNGRVGAATRVSGFKLIVAEDTVNVNRKVENYTVTLTSQLYVENSSSTKSQVSVSVSIPLIRSYEIIFNPNGGGSAPPTGYKGHGYPYTIPSQAPVRPSYRFVGWGTTPDATTPTYVAGDTYNTDASIELYAIWERDYYEVVVDGLTHVECVCPWKNDTIAVIDNKKLYSVGLGSGDALTPTKVLDLDGYTGTPQMCYTNGQLIIATNNYTLIVSPSNGTTKITDTILTNMTPTIYGLFGITSTKGVGTFTVPLR